MFTGIQTSGKVHSITTPVGKTPSLGFQIADYYATSHNNSVSCYVSVISPAEISALTGDTDRPAPVSSRLPTIPIVVIAACTLFAALMLAIGLGLFICAPGTTANPRFGLLRRIFRVKQIYRVRRIFPLRRIITVQRRVIPVSRVVEIRYVLLNYIMVEFSCGCKMCSYRCMSY